MIPGARFDSFLSEVASFLVAHATEFVVVRTCADGIQGVEIPSADTITQFATTALKGTGVNLGDSSSFQMSVATLRANGTRLILVQNNAKYDSYSDAAYATLEPAPIIGAFASMNTAGQAGHDFTVLQCQVSSTFSFTALTYLRSSFAGHLDVHHRRPHLRRGSSERVHIPAHVDQSPVRPRNSPLGPAERPEDSHRAAEHHPYERFH